MDIPLPFSLLNNNTHQDRLEVMPAFWWLYNMYALARNSSKYQQRDKRIHKNQHIEFEAFAPDTVEEILHGRHLLEVWTAKAYLRKQGKPVDNLTTDELAETGKQVLSGNLEDVEALHILGENMEKGKREVVIKKAWKAWRAYYDMLYHYAMKNLIAYMNSHPDATLADMHGELQGNRQADWVNLGGQLMPRTAVDQLREDIKTGVLNTWEAIHNRYDQLWAVYLLEKQRHAYAVLCALLNTQQLTAEHWQSSLDKAVSLQQFICDQVFESRQKDYDNYFRQITFKSTDEMLAAVGTIEDNSFIVQTREDTAAFIELVNQFKKRL